MLCSPIPGGGYHGARRESRSEGCQGRQNQDRHRENEGWAPEGQGEHDVPGELKSRRSTFTTEVSAKAPRLLASALLTSAAYLELNDGDGNPSDG